MSGPVTTPRARALASALREARKASDLNISQLANLTQIARTKLSQWENGHRIPSVEQVAIVLTALRVSPDERDNILELARNVKDPHWLTVGVEGVPAQLAGAVECERAASAIVEWIPIGIPGLLQTPEYTRAIKTTGGLSHKDIELRVMIAASRSTILTRRDPVNFEAFIGEAALYEPIGSPQVMTDQLQHLLDMSQRPNVPVRVVPLRIGWHPGWSGPFVLYEFPDASPVVHFEHHSSGAFIPNEHDVAEYRKAVDWLRRIAKDPIESSDLIAKIMEETENTT